MEHSAQDSTCKIRLVIYSRICVGIVVSNLPVEFYYSKVISKVSELWCRMWIESEFLIAIDFTVFISIHEKYTIVKCLFPGKTLNLH